MKIHGMKQSPFNCHPLGWFFLAKVQYLSNAETEVAAHGLEGLANLRNTMLDNGLQLPGSSCSSKQGLAWHSVGSDV